MKDITVFLKHILEECNFLMEQSANLTFTSFMEDPILQRAFVRSLEVIGEAVKNIPPELRAKYPKVPWKNVAGMRDILIHKYFGIDYNLVWKVIKESIPLLHKEILKILTDLERKEC